MIEAMCRFAPRRPGLLAQALFLLPLCAPAQNLAPASGRLLVSVPEVDDATFSRTVILLIHHDENGSIGVFINRPTNLDPAEIFSDSPAFESYVGNVFFGGPVSPQQPLMLLLDPPSLEEGYVRVLDRIYAIGDPRRLELVAPAERSPARVRIYAGRAEWSAGQLEGEISRGTWNVVRGRASLVFSDETNGLWARALSIESEDIVLRRAEPVPQLTAGMGKGTRPISAFK